MGVLLIATADAHAGSGIRVAAAGGRQHAAPVIEPDHDRVV